MININKTKKPLSIILILKKIIFSNKNFIRLLKTEKSFLKLNIYNIYFFLFYFYMINSLSYISFVKFNNLKLKKSLFTLNLFLKKDLKKSFKFFFKNIIMFLYKFSVIKHKKRKFFTLFTNKTKKIYNKFKKALKKKKRELKIKMQKERKQRRKLKKRKRNIQFERKRIMLYKKRKYELYKKFMTTKNLRIKIEKEINSLQQITNELIKKNKKSRLIKENNQQLKLINNKRKKLQ